MRHLTYLAVLAGCLACALALEPLLRVNVLRRWRRLLLTLVPVAAVFVAWDVAAVRLGWWSYDPAQTVGLVLPGRLPVEELLFFLAIPTCAILGFEAVRAVSGYRAGDEAAAGDATATAAAGPDGGPPTTTAAGGAGGGTTAAGGSGSGTGGPR